MSQEGGAALDADFAAGQDPELWDLEEDEAEEMADFEDAPGGPRVEATVSRARKGATVNTPITPPPKKTRTAAPTGAAQGGAQSSQAQRLSARAVMNLKDTELSALSQRACAIIPSIGKFLRFCIMFLCTVAWVSSSKHPKRLWSACFVRARDR